MTDLKNICLDCGMCSDGSMYRFVAIEDGDPLEPLRAAGASFVTHDGQMSFLLPCPAFRGGGCSIYEHRPTVCRNYQCFLLRRYQAGEVSFDEARSLIERTIGLRDRVRPALTAFVEPQESLALSGLYARLDEKLDAMPDPAAARLEMAELFLEIAALRVILAREFEPQPSADLVQVGAEPREPTAAELSGKVDRALGS